ncbi:hypothetical protein GGI12_006236, partial [Dipsacomyces acuminosporus]
MSLTGFLFGNVDEEGRLSDTELDDELRNTLGGEEANEYLTGILGSSLFSDTADKKQQRSVPVGENTQSAVQASTAPTPAVGSPTVKPNDDAIDFSDFNELADDAAVPVKWRESLPLPTVRLKPSATIPRAEVDDNYDSDEEEVEEEQDANMADSASNMDVDVDTGSVLAVMPANAPDSVAADSGGAGESDYEQNALLESDGEDLEDLFDSPVKGAPSTTASNDKAEDLLVPATSNEQPADLLHGTPVADGVPLEPKAAIPEPPRRAVKRIPSGTLRFTDYFGCQIIRHVKKPRRAHLLSDQQLEEDDGDLQRTKPAYPA